MESGRVSQRSFLSAAHLTLLLLLASLATWEANDPNLTNQRIPLSSARMTGSGPEQWRSDN